jgi:hypothetical protein
MKSYEEKHIVDYRSMMHACAYQKKEHSMPPCVDITLLFHYLPIS